ncbi:putative zinc-binding metallopeptidase [Halobacteriovorax sp. GB3]|uniref:putative zinc-binding metallopeptidase n=1 Tax=Halobacteriovorax sp. GB3 TaxID=2719615 RepID=UPI00235F5D81|nr:putative zinc-binding metallopeptidase [Halobacteriovorax sp. GB3]MDD0851865.1 putative zinc-binding metallopeptidase [Halobacteriovorax sp. GB3]
MDIIAQKQIRSFSNFPKDHWVFLCVMQVQKELRERGILFEIKTYIGDDWYCLDHQIAISIPFYLYDRSLFRYIKKYTCAAEGGSQKEVLKILRHEVGHALENAFLLKENSKRVLAFGDSSKKYPRRYFAKASRYDYVHHLGGGYAQSHPDEDFAETFAIWLSSTKTTRKKYKSKAKMKLETMDTLMEEIKGKRAQRTRAIQTDSAKKDRRTIEHYIREKVFERGSSLRTVMGRAAKELFSRSQTTQNTQALHFLKSERKKIALRVEKRSGIPIIYSEALMKRFEEISTVWNLELRTSKRETSKLMENYLLSNATHLIKTGHYKVPM